MIAPLSICFCSSLLAVAGNFIPATRWGVIAPHVYFFIQPASFCLPLYSLKIALSFPVGDKCVVRGLLCAEEVGVMFDYICTKCLFGEITVGK